MVHFGKYLLFLRDLLINRESLKVYYKRTLTECLHIGLNSIFIILFISICLGVVSSLQTISTLKKNIFFVDWLLGFGIRDLVITELAPTVTVLIFSGRIGSSIAGEIGSMKITEQIDALEAMGINSKSYLVLPKIVASLLMYPLLVIMSAFTQITSSFLMSTLKEGIDKQEYVYGLRYNFSFMPIFQACVKSFIFAFLISSIASYVGYHIRGGSLEVGRVSTKAVTISSVASLLANYLIVQMFV